MKNRIPVDLSGFVNAKGEAIYDNGSPSFAAPPKPRTEAPPSHKGFLVEGYPPGYIAEQKRLAEESVRLWGLMSSAAQADRIKAGDRAPKPWEEASWMAKNKRKRVAKPYHVPDAADVAAGLAIKGGWNHVRVTELKKGEKE